VLCNLDRTRGHAAQQGGSGSRWGKVAIVAVPIEPVRVPSSALFRLTTGLDVLNEWSQTATQAEKNVVDAALLAIVGKSVFAKYVVVDDPRKALEFFVLAKCDLAIKVHVYTLNAFGIVYVGPTASAPGLDCAGPDPELAVTGQ
jgi:hypothetical protein